MNQREPSQLAIRKEKYWTYIEPNGNFELPDGWDVHGGKLMVFGNEEQIVPLAQKLGKYVAKGKIRFLKYAPPLPPAFKSWALMVYCLDSESNQVWEILQREGVKRKIWKLDSQTEKDWSPGGKLRKRVYGEYDAEELASYCKKTGIPIEVARDMMGLPVKRHRPAEELTDR